LRIVLHVIIQSVFKKKKGDSWRGDEYEDPGKTSRGSPVRRSHESRIDDLWIEEEEGGLEKEIRSKIFGLETSRKELKSMECLQKVGRGLDCSDRIRRLYNKGGIKDTILLGMLLMECSSQGTKDEA